MLEPLRNDSKGQGLHLGDGLVAVLPVAQDPGQGRHLSQPTAISFAPSASRSSSIVSVTPVMYTHDRLPNKRVKATAATPVAESGRPGAAAYAPVVKRAA